LEEAIEKVLMFTLIPVIAVIVGGTISSYQQPSQGLRVIIQHFAAGVVFSAVALQILPELVLKLRIFPLVFGFLLGVVFMIGAGRLIEKLIGGNNEVEGAGSRGLAFASGIDMFIDGLLLGVSFGIGEKQGIMITIALTIELLLLGLSVASSMVRDRVIRGRVIAITTMLAFCVVLGSTIGCFLFEGLSDSALVSVLAFATSAFLYLVTEELLVEAHKGPDTTLATTMFFVGFLLMMVIETSLAK
jgi:zinc transporter, ZIP family